MYPILLTIFTVVIAFMSVVYFYLFSRNSEQFLRYWGLAWVAYAASLFLMLLYLIAFNNEIVLEVRKLFDMINGLAMLMGVYAFSHVRIPGAWIRFSLYMVLLSVLCIVYDLDLYSFYLPISLYQLCMGGVMLWHIAIRWDLHPQEKVIAAIAFSLWGLGKPLLSMYEISSGLDFAAMGMELLLANILNFCLLIVYAQNQIHIKELTGSIYSDVIENTSDVIFYYTFEPFPQMKFITPSVKHMTGYGQTAFYGDPTLLIKIAGGSFADELSDVLSGKSGFESGQVVSMSKRNGDMLWVDIKTKLLLTDDGRPSAVQGTIRDISEMKNLEMEQVKARQEHDQLLSYISHELRTPVTSMAGYLSAINDGIMSKPEDLKSVLGILSSRTMVLKQLVDDLDQLSKMSTGQFSFDFGVCDIIELSSKLANINSSDIENAGYIPVVTGIASLPSNTYIAADETRIGQVLHNLTSNAIKYSHPGTRITLHFGINEAAKSWTVSVSDKGPGIDEAEIIHVFDRFYRGSDPDKKSKSGRGLGLTLSKDIIEAHNGTITVVNDKICGCTFTISIPIIEDPVI